MDTSNLCHRIQPASGSKNPARGFDFTRSSFVRSQNSFTMKQLKLHLRAIRFEATKKLTKVSFPPSSFTFFYHSKPHRLHLFHIFTLHLWVPRRAKVEIHGNSKEPPNNHGEGHHEKSDSDQKLLAQGWKQTIGLIGEKSGRNF